MPLLRQLLDDLLQRGMIDLDRQDHADDIIADPAIPTTANPGLSTNSKRISKLVNDRNKQRSFRYNGQPNYQGTAAPNISATDLNDIQNYSPYLEMQNLYSALPDTSRLKQLAAISSESLANLSDRHQNSVIPPYPVYDGAGSVDSVNLLSVPQFDNKNTRMDFYNDSLGLSKNEARINISPFNTPGTTPMNPLKVFGHEAKHGITDQLNRPHQKEYMSFLANEETKLPPKTPVYKQDNWMTDLFAGSQNIINEPHFSVGYPAAPYFTKGMRKEGGFQDLAKAAPKIPKTIKGKRGKSRTMQVMPPVTNFREANTELQNIRNDPINPDPADLFFKLTEFPGFLTERLSEDNANTNPLTITGHRDDSRRFLKEILRTMHRDYQNASGKNMITEYPQLHESFIDRYNQLRLPNRATTPQRTITGYNNRPVNDTTSHAAKGPKPLLNNTSIFPLPKY